MTTKWLRTYLNQEYKKQEIKKTQEFFFDKITKHAKQRLDERFFYWWVDIEQIREDIKKPIKWKKKGGVYEITGKYWTYVISFAKTLITVI